MTDSLPHIASLFPPADEAAWRARVDGVLKGADFARKLVHHTLDGLQVQPLHAARADSPAVPGIRGARPWAAAARVDHPVAEAASAQALADLEGGADMLTLVFPGGRSGRGYGLPCGTVAELDAALAGTRLDLIRLRIDPAPAGRLNALMVAALAEQRKLDPAMLDIDFGMDPLGSLLTLGHVPWDWATMGNRLAEAVMALSARGYAGPFLTVDLRPFQEAGASEGQELAAALATGVHYIRALEARGLPLGAAFRAVSFVVPLDADQFMGIAKLRALRLLWARVAQWSEAAPEAATIHAETSWRMLTRRDPHVNILRATIAAFAAGVGGADTLTVLPFTQALGLPEPMARRLARNTSIVLQDEANLWRVADPAAGSGAVEALTEALSARAWALFQEIEGEGGILISAVLARLQSRIAETSAARARAAATRKDPITGVSAFPNMAEIPPEVLPVKPSAPRPVKARAKGRFGPDTEGVIAGLLAGASRAEAAQPPEGETRASPLVSHRDAEAWEALRDRSDAFLKKRKRRPGVAIVTLGPLAEHGARLQFMQGLFAAAGMEIAEGAALVCLVAGDAAYAAEGAKTARGLKAPGRTLWLAGRPGELEATLKRAGVKRFVAMGDDMLAVLDEALRLAGA
jgi:methylmalonyl-CoA mutase